MSFEEILKSLTPEQQAVVKAAMDAAKKPVEGEEAKVDPKDLEAAKAEAERLKKEKEDLEAEVCKLRNPESKSEDEILKSLDPAVRSLIEKSRNEAAAANAAILKMKDEADTAEALAKAKELANLGTDEAELCKAFKVLKNKDVECYTTVYNVLKAANAKLAGGLNLGELGTTVTKGADDTTIAKAADTAWNAVEKAAEEIVKSKGCSKEMAITHVINEQPDLYNNYLACLK